MSNAAKIIYKKLSNTTGITELVSTRIYPMILPQQVSLPAITFSQVSQGPIHASQRDPNISQSRVQVSSWSTSYAQVQAVSKQVKRALQDYSGSTWLDVQRIFFDDEVELSSIDPESKGHTFQIATDFIVWWSS